MNQYDYPELSVKIGIDEGENVIVQYGHDKSSPIDILGYCMSIAAKITSLADPNTIVYIIHFIQMNKFEDVKYNTENGNILTNKLVKFIGLMQCSFVGITSF